MAQTNRTQPRLIDENVAKAVNCRDLYEATSEELKTSNILIYLVPGYMRGGMFIPSGRKVILPKNNTVSLASFFMDGDDTAIIEIDYSYDGLRPDTLMTRAEFVMEALSILEERQQRMVYVNASKAEEMLETIEHLKGLYALQELIDIAPTFDQIRSITADDLNVHQGPDGVS